MKNTRKITMDSFAIRDNEDLDDYLKRIYHLSPDVKILSLDVFLNNLPDNTFLDFDSEQTFKDNFRFDTNPSPFQGDGSAIDDNVIFVLTIEDKDGNIMHLNAVINDDIKDDIIQ